MLRLGRFEGHTVASLSTAAAAAVATGDEAVIDDTADWSIGGGQPQSVLVPLKPAMNGKIINNQLI